MASPLQLSIVNFNKNSYIIVEGKQKADYFYILRSGKVRISKEVEVVEEEGETHWLRGTSSASSPPCPRTATSRPPWPSPTCP